VLNSKNFGLAQNRERIFIVGTRGQRGRKVFPLTGDDGQADGVQGQYANTLTARYTAGGSVSYIIESEQYAQVKQIGNISDRKGGFSNPQTGRVYSVDGIAPTLNTTQGGGHEPKIAIPVMVSEATKKGYAKAFEGDSINLAVPNSKTRRGRVGKGIANTLDTSCNQGVVVGEERTNDNGKTAERNTIEILRVLQSEIGTEALSEWRLAIAAAFQQAEILQLRMHEKSVDYKRKDEGGRTGQQNHSKENHFRCDAIRKKVRTVRKNNEKHRRSSQRWRPIQQFANQFATIMQGLPYERTQREKVLQSLQETCKGSLLMREAFEKISQAWEPIYCETWRTTFRIRRLMPKEAFRLQGFPDSYFNKAQAVNSDSQLYKQAGNSVSVPVIYEIAKRLGD